MTNIHEYLIVAIDCADAKLHNINISVIWQCLGQLPPFRPLNLWRNQIAPFVCLRQSGERGMISTQLEAWKKIGPWHPGAVQMCRHWNAIQIGWKHNWHITERKQWGPKTLGGTLNLLLDWSWSRWEKKCENDGKLSDVAFIFCIGLLFDLGLIWCYFSATFWRSLAQNPVWRWKEVLNAPFTL